MATPQPPTPPIPPPLPAPPPPPPPPPPLTTQIERLSGKSRHIETWHSLPFGKLPSWLSSRIHHHSRLGLATSRHAKRAWVVQTRAPCVRTIVEVLRWMKEAGKKKVMADERILTR